MSRATLQAIRDTLLSAARDAIYRPHAGEAPRHVIHARSINRQLVRLARAARS
jgi:hypothetical protein